MLAIVDREGEAPIDEELVAELIEIAEGKVSLPVLVECAPYRTRLMAAACVGRWRIANGWKRGDGAGTEAAKSADLRQSQCKGCDVGEARAKGEPETKATPFATAVEGKRAAARARGVEIRAQVAQEERDVGNLEKRKCGECLDVFQPRRSDSRFCSPACGQKNWYDRKHGNPPGRPAAGKVAAPRPKLRDVTPVLALPPVKRELSPLERYFALRGVVTERKRVAEKAIAEAEAEVSAHLESHPEVRDEARILLQELVG